VKPANEFCFVSRCKREAKEALAKERVPHQINYTLPYFYYKKCRFLVLDKELEEIYSTWEGNIQGSYTNKL
jgi:hypothetical protein